MSSSLFTDIPTSGWLLLEVSSKSNWAMKKALSWSMVRPSPEDPPQNMPYRSGSPSSLVRSSCSVRKFQGLKRLIHSVLNDQQRMESAGSRLQRCAAQAAVSSLPSAAAPYTSMSQKVPVQPCCPGSGCGVSHTQAPPLSGSDRPWEPQLPSENWPCARWEPPRSASAIATAASGSGAEGARRRLAATGRWPAAMTSAVSWIILDS
mmetsp:Transcript_33281/g.85054  ORF Transcript_33281/g.85054 Transcript_33281/m.85054 type:complete len:206 (-) Transcript_33281:90-707(-)